MLRLIYAVSVVAWARRKAMHDSAGRDEEPLGVACCVYIAGFAC